MTDILRSMSRACHPSQTTSWSIHDPLGILSFFSWNLWWIWTKTCTTMHLLLLLSELLMLWNSTLCNSLPCLRVVVEVTSSLVENCILSNIASTLLILWNIWVSMCSSTPVNLSIWSLWMALVLHFSSRSIGTMSCMMISLIHHSDYSTALASMSSMHLHWLHHHLVLSTLICSVVEWLWILAMINCLYSTSRFRSSHQFLLVEWAIEVLNHWSSLLKGSSIISDLLLWTRSLPLVISITWITSSTYTSLAASTSCILPSWLTTTLSSLTVTCLRLVVLRAH